MQHAENKEMQAKASSQWHETAILLPFALGRLSASSRKADPSTLTLYVPQYVTTGAASGGGGAA
jgi:hypothetical protein